MIKKFFFPALLIISIISLTISSCSSRPNGYDFIRNKDSLDIILDRYVDEGLDPLIYARLENLDGDVLYEHSAVNRNLLPLVDINGQTWFRIWSMSKIITITIALDLVEDGILDLNDPVTKYIPEFENLKVAVSKDGKVLSEIKIDDPALSISKAMTEEACPFKLVSTDSLMTVLHLLNHEAGFYYATTNIYCLDSLLATKNLPTAKNSQELIHLLAEMPLIQHPGTKHFYGTNTTVLGLVAERATGKSLKQLVEERLTKPLGINGLQYGLPPHTTLLPTFSAKDTILRTAKPEELDIFGPDVPDYDLNHELYFGGEGMLATADGYADFLRMLLNRGTLNGKRFLEKATVEDIYSPHTLLDSPYGHNGYNLWVSGDSMRIKEQGEAGLWLGGGYENTHFWVDPKRNFVAIIMSQMSWGTPEGYTRNDRFRGALYKQFWKDEK